MKTSFKELLEEESRRQWMDNQEHIYGSWEEITEKEREDYRFEIYESLDFTDFLERRLEEKREELIQTIRSTDDKISAHCYEVAVIDEILSILFSEDSNWNLLASEIDLVLDKLTELGYKMKFEIDKEIFSEFVGKLNAKEAIL